ncbi:MAG TPA: ABC transporter ATP-binding protein, partial [Anaerolineae bacterium]|nr:ABC transporter ATP-binding protein [Anaerolineae bacterium]
MFGGGRGPAMMMEREVLKPKNVSETLKRFGTYFRPYMGVLILVMAFVVVSTWAQVTVPDLIGQSVDCYLTPTVAQQFGGFTGSGVAQTSADSCWYDPDVAHARTADQNIAGLGGLILKIVGLYLLSAVLTGLTFFGMSWAGQHVLRKLRTEVFEHIHRLSLSYYAEHEAGDVMSRITNDADTIQQALSFALINVIGGALLLIWIAYTMLRLSFAYALIALVVVPFMWFATKWFSDQARKAFRKSRVEMGSVNAELQQSISGVREVQAFNREQENIDNFRDVNASNRDANIRAVAFTSALPPTLEALGFVAMALVVGIGGLLILRNQTFLGATISLGLVITFLGYVQRFNQPIQQIAVLWTNIQSAIAGGERIFGLLDEVPAVQDKPAAQAMPTIKGTVEFQGVHAEYEKGVPVLSGIDFKAEPGQMIAVVGPTGAGKTTIINLIPRFYDVTGGAVKIDGVDVRDVTAASLRKQIGIVLQDSFLFSDTVMNNIRFGRPAAADDEVFAAAKLARADTFIERLAEGYQT